jgi:hypothetical protein
MELVLNLAWLLLVLPACWLWRGSRSARAEHRFTSMQCLLALGCVLVMLFPVVSATDDLLALRTEMEESPVSKRSIRQADHDKASARDTRLESPMALPPTLPLFALSVGHGTLALIPSSSPLAPPSILPAGRAPPVSCLA